ncbi:abortive infection protein AbiGII [Streptococcus pneumoniae]|nr:nucleotidyl transferase AbiEii/AbiGii toxin family protein [Streptococcus pneumoniae]CIZ15684.1 abortive infection protein AbiGII [Streptococcus pneumoniae]
MSSEQQERMAVQYAERSLLFTVKSLLKILEWSRRQALAQDSAYKIGVQKLEELLQSPYAIDTINLKKDFLDKPIDIEKFKAFLEKEEIPLAIAWQGDSGFSLKLNATFDTLKEVVFIDITTGDKITPREITYSMTSIFTNESIKIWTYNLETVLAEKLETIISRGLASTRPRDRYDLFTLYKLRKEEINLEVLKNALENTAEKRESKDTIYNWEEQVRGIEISDYQKELWIRYQRQFKYAKDISFDNSVQVIKEIMQQIF